MHKLPFNLNDPYRHMQVTLDGLEEVANFNTITEELNYLHQKINVLTEENKQLRESFIKQTEKEYKYLTRLGDALAALTAKQLGLKPEDVTSFTIADDGSVTLEYVTGKIKSLKDDLTENTEEVVTVYHAPTIETNEEEDV